MDNHFVDKTLCAQFTVMTDITGHLRTAQYFDRDGKRLREPKRRIRMSTDEIMALTRTD